MAHIGTLKFEMNPDLGSKLDSALEASVAKSARPKIINVDGASMLVGLITDKMVYDAELMEVSNPIMFERGNIPTPTGLFSQEIFGTTQYERRKKHAYIDLRMKFFHPYVFEILKKVYRKIDKVASGEGCWTINNNGELVEITDETDPLYDEDSTGLQWLIKNFRKIKFETNDTTGRKTKLELLDVLDENEIFITKWVVLPVFYRDVDMKDGRLAIPDINFDYNALIRYCSMLSRDAIGFLNNKAMYTVQNKLVSIRQRGQKLVEKKYGDFHRNILGKSIDYGARSVISTSVLNEVDLPSDNQIDILHTGVPLAQCLEIGLPFVLKYCMDFFRREFDGITRKAIARYDKKTGIYNVEEVRIKDQMSIFTDNYIKKKMQTFITSYGKRFEPITIETEDGEFYPISFTGRFAGSNINSSNTSSIVNRPFTWTDLFYIAATETLSDKWLWCTRYPITDMYSTFPSKCVPISTVKTFPVMINETIYKHYPVIDLSMSESKISTYFIDTAEISNLYLKAINGDFDGDQISLKLCYTLEANKEAEEIATSLKHFMDLNDNFIRNISNEAYQTFFSMTKR